MNQVTFEDKVYGVPEFNQVQIVMANSARDRRAGPGPRGHRRI
jgi:hypothetical protein